MTQTERNKVLGSGTQNPRENPRGCTLALFVLTSS